jgi:hypothetical protein
MGFSWDLDWADRRIEIFRPQTVVAYSGSLRVPERKISSSTRSILEPLPFCCVVGVDHIVDQAVLDKLNEGPKG